MHANACTHICIWLDLRKLGKSAQITHFEKQHFSWSLLMTKTFCKLKLCFLIYVSMQHETFSNMTAAFYIILLWWINVWNLSHFCVQTCTFLQVQSHTHTHARTHARMHARTHTHTHTHPPTHGCTHAHAHTQKQISFVVIINHRYHMCIAS